MYDTYPFGPGMKLPIAAGELIIDVAAFLAPHAAKAFQLRPSGRRAGKTLRPGSETPMWNAVQAELRQHLRKYGAQAHLGRWLGLPRQRVNAFVRSGTEMPDCERTLQLLIWLAAVRRTQTRG